MDWLPWLWPNDAYADGVPDAWLAERSGSFRPTILDQWLIEVIYRTIAPESCCEKCGQDLGRRLRTVDISIAKWFPLVVSGPWADPGESRRGLRRFREASTCAPMVPGRPQSRSAAAVSAPESVTPERIESGERHGDGHVALHGRRRVDRAVGPSRLRTCGVPPS